MLAAVTALAGASPARAAPVPVLVIEGRGHGHGVGMAQDGALWMGRGGSTTAQILSQFYPGTTLGRSGGEVRVAVLSAAANTTVVRFPNGGEVRDAREGPQSAGFPVKVGPGGQARLRVAGGRFSAEVLGGSSASGGARRAGFATASAGSDTLAPAAGAQAEPSTTVPAATTTTTAPGLGLLRPGDRPLLPTPTGPLLPVPSVPTLPSTTVPPAVTAPPGTAAGGPATSSRSLWAVPSGGGTVEVAERGSRYRGVVQALGGGPLRLVNHVDVEQYLRGMGEVRDPSWPAASLRAQAIAARTYALRAVGGGGELCDTQRCQVYLGAQAEYPAMDKAVGATRGQVLLFRRTLAAAVYSANGGGFSASTEEGFGTPGSGYPYLRPAQYPTRDPAPWTVTVSLRDVAARAGLRGRVAAVTTRTGPSGRVVQVTVEGSAGRRTVSGIEFDRALGLRSTMFTVRLGEAATAPPPPPVDGGPVQGLPEGGEVSADAVPGGPPQPASVESAVKAGAGGAGGARSTAAAGPAAGVVAGGALAWLLLMGASVGLATSRLRLRRPPPPGPTPGT